MADWAASSGHSLVAEYVDGGVSGTTDRRPEFQRMVSDALHPSKPYDIIVVHSRSRLFRNLQLMLQWEMKLKSAGVQIVSITQQTGDDEVGEMVKIFFSTFDQYQSAENSKHTKRAMQENAKQGYWNGSVPPYGFRTVDTSVVGNRGRLKRRIEIDQTEAEVVARIYDLYLNGHQGKQVGMKAIVSLFNSQGISMRGRPWRIQKLNEILSNPVYIGRFYFNRRDSRSGTIKPEAEWIPVEVPAIISDYQFEQAAQRREALNPKKGSPRALASPALLVGLLKCAKCGSGLTLASGKSGAYSYYKDTTRINKGVNACSSRNLPRYKTDNAVLEALGNRVFTPERVGQMLRELKKRRRMARTVENSQLLRLNRELREATAGVERLHEAVEKGIVPLDDALRTRVHKAKARREECLLEIAKLKDQNEIDGMNLDSFAIADFRRALLDALADPNSGLGKAYLRLLVDEIIVDDNQLQMKGSLSRLASAVGQFSDGTKK